MKKTLLFILAGFLSVNMLFAGGIVTNTNQSAAWARYFSRYATLDIDGVYFNPAGMAMLPEGFHFSVNNQSVWQTQTLTNDFELLNYGPDYIGKVKAPVFPSIYAAYKIGKFAISFGFNPIGGGGSATYEKGLPAFEFMSGVNLVNTLNASGITTSNYHVDTYLDGSSVYYGYQAGLSYQINDMIGVFAGARYVSAINKYEGSLKNLQINPTDPLVNPSGEMISAPLYFSEMSDTTKSLADNVLYPAQTMASALNPDDPVNALLVPLLQAFGVDPTGMTNAQAAAAFAALGDNYTQLSQEAAASSQLTADQEVDVKQTGSGITPIFGIHFSFPMLDVALKYEMKTSLKLTNATTKDFLLGYNPETGDPVTMYPDGAVTNADMPAMLSGGVNVRPVKRLQASAGFEYYWDKNVNWDGREKDIENNSYNLNVSLQFKITNKILVSGGYNYASMGVGKNYQSDLSYSLSSSSIGFGGAVDFTPNIRLNLGYSMVMYKDDVVDVPTVYTQTYAKDTKIFAVGLDFSF